MQVILNDDEIMAILKLKKILIKSTEPAPLFLDFIYERMRDTHKENELVDYMHKLAEWRDLVSELCDLFAIQRRP